MRSVDSGRRAAGGCWQCVAVLCIAALLASCAQIRNIKRQEDPGLYNEGSGDQAAQAAQERRADSAASGSTAANAEVTAKSEIQQETRIERGPGLSPLKTLAITADQDYVPDLSGEDLAGNYNNVSLPSFINLVFGEQLDLPYSLDAAITNQADLVTLRLSKPVSPEELFLIARRTLRDYGVSTRYENGVFVFSINKNIAATTVPILVTGRALPEVPESHRPVFVFVPLQAVETNKVRNWLRSALSGQKIEILEDPVRNSIILRGKASVVEQGLAMIEILDQPHMRGKFSINIEPAHAKVNDLATDLVAILQSEGYDASMRPPIGAILLVPLRSNNQLVVFASSQETLDHVESWVKIIDRRQQLAIENGIFSYEVNSTQASYIVELLNSLSRADESSVRENDEGVQAAGNSRGNRSDDRGSQFVVDSNRNAILYRGSGKEWAELLPVIKQMDKLAPSVLVEVLLAEINLIDTDTSSFSFLASTTLDQYGLTYGTLGLIDSGSSAFSAVLDKAGETRAILKVLYENKRAEIRSRPRLMVKSGQTATIDVGTEIPVLTTASQSVTNPDAPLVQDIIYRSTGVKLQIKPVVHNSGYVDIEVIQELSEAEVNETSGIDSPTIRNRSLQTIVTLRDGGSILLGGLISSTTSDNETGVPILGALPGVGAFFRSDGEIEERRELLIMIIPYVMDGPKDAEELTRQLTNSMIVDADASFADP